jgi:hypothetical protein
MLASVMYTLCSKNQAPWYFVSPAPEATRHTVAIIIQVVRSFSIFVLTWHFSLFHSFQSFTPDTRSQSKEEPYI